MLAFDAVHNMKKFYSIDESRVYVGGASGGGRIASALAVLYPELFHGGLYIIGANYFKPLRTNRGPYAPGFAPPSDKNFELIRARNRYTARFWRGSSITACSGRSCPTEARR